MTPRDEPITPRRGEPRGTLWGRRSADLPGHQSRIDPDAFNMSSSVNVLALVKDGERFVFLYDDTSIGTLLQTLGKYAADPELSFSWYDAAVLSQKVRKLQKRSTSDEAPRSQPTSFRRSA